LGAAQQRRDLYGKRTAKLACSPRSTLRCRAYLLKARRFPPRCRRVSRDADALPRQELAIVIEGKLDDCNPTFPRRRLTARLWLRKVAPPSLRDPTRSRRGSDCRARTAGMNANAAAPVINQREARQGRLRQPCFTWPGDHFRSPTRSSAVALAPPPLPSFVAGARARVRGTLVAVHFRDERGFANFPLEQADGSRIRALGYVQQISHCVRWCA
jgi:hypothetical protein